MHTTDQDKNSSLVVNPNVRESRYLQRTTESDIEEFGSDSDSDVGMDVDGSLVFKKLFRDQAKILRVSSSRYSTKRYFDIEGGDYSDDDDSDSDNEDIEKLDGHFRNLLNNHRRNEQNHAHKKLEKKGSGSSACVEQSCLPDQQINSNAETKAA